MSRCDIYLKMKWLDALRIFNRGHPGKWCIPKRGTPEYQTVVDIMNGKHMRRQEKIQGSGMINDWLKKISAKRTAREDKEWRDSHPQYFLKTPKTVVTAPTTVVTAPTTVVGSGRRGRPKGSKNKK